MLRMSIAVGDADQASASCKVLWAPAFRSSDAGARVLERLSQVGIRDDAASVILAGCASPASRVLRSVAGEAWPALLRALRAGPFILQMPEPEAPARTFAISVLRVALDTNSLVVPLRPRER